nr:ORF1 [Torque teno felis virus]
MYRRYRRRFGRFRRRWRRGRYHMRNGRRRGHRWRRRWVRRGRRVVTQNVPGRHKTIWVRGWEPLGNLCASDGPKSEATPYFSVEPQSGLQATWHGTWGHHHFTFGNLLQRSLARWNMWSADWESYDYVMFVGGTISIPQTSSTAWMITFDEYLQTAQTRYNEKNKEDHWGHPGVLLNVPKTHIIFPPWIYKHPRMYKIRVRPPPGMARHAEGFLKAMSLHMVYTGLWNMGVALKDAFLTRGVRPSATDTCQQAPWWAANNYVAGKWIDRTKYDAPCLDCTQCQNKHNWGPFLPQTFGRQSHESSLFFLYKLKFKLVGNSIWRPLPRQFQSQGLVPEPEGPNQPSRRLVAKRKIQHEAEKPAAKKQRRPLSEADIWQGDLDSDGLLKERAFRRITGHNPGDELDSLARRLRSLHDKLHVVLGHRGLLRK